MEYIFYNEEKNRKFVGAPCFQVESTSVGNLSDGISLFCGEKKSGSREGWLLKFEIQTASGKKVG